MADEPLIAFQGGTTHVDCDFANHALAEGYFDRIVNPRITGTCPMATPVAEPDPVIGTPNIPLGPPIAPWCDCTDEEWQAMLSLMAEQNMLINPGFASENPIADWAEAFDTDVGTVVSPEFWSDGQVPAFNDLSVHRYLQFK